MNFRVIALASCVALGSIALGDKAHAQSVDVPFGGTLTNTCVFGAPTAGVVARTGVSNAVEGSAGVTGFNVGTAGRVTLNCNAGGSVLTAVPAIAAVPAAFAPTIRQAVVQVNTSAVYTSRSTGANFDTGIWNKPTAAAIVPAGLQTLNVAMIAGTPGSTALPPAGTYTYNVRLTATSN